MKNVIFVLLLLASSLAQSGEFDGYDTGYINRIKKMRDFIGKNKKCFASTFMVAKKSTAKYVQQWAESVICVSNMTFNLGSMREKKGCSIMAYYPDSDRYVPLSLPPYEIPFVGKECGSGGFEELMDKKDIWFPVGDNKPFPAKYLLIRAPGVPRDLINVHIVRTKNDSTQKYLENEIQSKE